MAAKYLVSPTTALTTEVVGRNAFQCPLCPRVFKRLEHLKRHQRGHQLDKRLACSVCAKTFTRSDIRNRHESLHGLKRPRTARIRACLECARIRGRCDKAEPSCSRCASRFLACVYPEEYGGAGWKQHRSDEGDTANEEIPPAGPENISDPLSQDVDNFSDFLLTSPTEDFSSNSIKWLAADYSVDIDDSSLLNSCLGPKSPQDIDAATSTQPIPPRWNGDQSPQNYSSYIGCSLASLFGSGSSAASAVVSSMSHTSKDRETTIAVGPITSQLSTDSVSSRLVAPDSIYATSTVGSRIPCTARTRRIPPSIWGLTALPPVTAEMTNDNDDTDKQECSFPNMSAMTCPSVETRGIMVESHTYSLILSHYQLLYPNTDIETGCFPSYAHVNLFAALFFEHFDPILSIYNSRVAALDKHWVLALAVIAVGSQYSGTVQMAQCVVPLHEFLRRALVSSTEECGGGGSGDDGTRLARAQALAISQVGTMYYGSRRLDRLARGRRAELADIATTTMRFLAEKDEQRQNKRLDDEPLTDSWKKWMVQEAWRRLAYTIWLLDCMSTYHFGQRPMLSLECTTRCDLPYDGLWAAHTVEQWSLRYKSADYSRHPSLESAVRTLFRLRQRPSDLGEFADLLLLHGVYEHIYYVEDYYKSPLSEWIPTASPVSRREAVSIGDAETANTSRSSSKLFDSWRSAAMDCVDVLHWAANGTVARLAGAEHPAVLHLQFSRVVLWSPYAAIRTIAEWAAGTARAGEGPNCLNFNYSREGQWLSQTEVIQHENTVMQWAQGDEAKSRLTALHCGVVFWHVQRYSCWAFYEPHTVYLATLVLWAFRAYGLRSDDNSSLTAGKQFVHLDRPCDDEMVQFFVRYGRPGAVVAHVAGVGDIYEAGASSKLLRLGRDILSAKDGVSMAWGRTGKYIQVLTKLDGFVRER